MIAGRNRPQSRLYRTGTDGGIDLHSWMLALTILMFMAGTPSAPAADPVASIAFEAGAVSRVVEGDAVDAWLRAATHLPAPPEVSLVFDRRVEQGMRRRVMTPEQAEALPEAEQDGLVSFTFGGDRYYATFYGTGVAYAPILARAADALGLDSFAGTKILDWGYGQLGQVEMLAQVGAEVVGIEADPVVHALYAQGEASRDLYDAGSIRLLQGYWPTDDAIRADAGGGYDLILARNFLKRGYVNPEGQTPDFTRVDFGMPDRDLLGRLYDALAPGGAVVIWNLGGGPAWVGERYNAAADIRDPFAAGLWEAAGFELVAFEADDTDVARAVADALGWGDSMDLTRLRAVCTVARRPASE